MTTRRTTHIRRILVAVDSCSHDPAALESVVDLASRLEAELSGLFVEDINLLRSAALSFVRQVSLPTAVEEQFDATSIERQLRVRALRAEKCLATAAERKKVKWSFRTVRGRASDEVVSAAEDADLLVVERAVRPSPGEFHGAGPTRMAASRVPRSLLLLRRRGLLGRPTLIAYDGGEDADRAVEVAARLSGEGAAALEVLALAGNAEKQTQLIRKLRDHLKGSAPRPWQRIAHRGGGLSDSEVQEPRGRCRLPRPSISPGPLALHPSKNLGSLVNPPPRWAARHRREQVGQVR
jgi:nucleotide-binding universal stress UspA family protein